MTSISMFDTTLESQLVLVIDDDVMVTESLAFGLERAGRTVITCNDVESAQLIVERFAPSHIVADVKMSGPFGYEGLDFILYAKRHSAASRLIMMTGDAPEALQLEASERGAVAFLRKPFEVKELDALLDLVACSGLSSSAGSARVIRVPLLDQIIRSADLVPMFQPVVALGEHDSWSLAGFEALARFRSDSPLRDPETLFRYAARKQRVGDLEIACTAQAFKEAACLPPHLPLFLNMHPQVFETSDMFWGTFLSQAERANVSSSRIVMEITEQEPLSDKPVAMNRIKDLKQAGVRFAFDDIGIAYSHLPLIDKIRPAFLKISQHFGTDFERDSTKTKIIRNLHSLARDFGCDLILEGIESRTTAEMAARLGIPYAQGYFFGRPADSTSFRKDGADPSRPARKNERIEPPAIVGTSAAEVDASRRSGWP